KVLEHPDEAIDFDLQAGFLAHLTHQRVVGEFADFDVAAGQEPEVVRLDAEQQHVFAVEHDPGNAEVEQPVVALEGDHFTVSLSGRGGSVSLPRTAGARAPVTLGILPWRPRSIW